MRVFVLTLALLVAVVEGEEPGCRVTRCVKRGASCRRVENDDLRVITGGWEGTCGWNGCGTLSVTGSDCPQGSTESDTRCCRKLFGKCVSGSEARCCWDGCGSGSQHGDVEQRIRYHAAVVHYGADCITVRIFGPGLINLVFKP
eukprot:587794-Pyramimonas_sp.AAC.1